MRYLIALLLIYGVFFFVEAQNGSVLFEWKYINVIEGYDHQSKMEFFLNDFPAGESEITKYSEQNKHIIVVAEGVHTFTMQNWALYEGEWEEVLITNNYSLDAHYTISLKVKAGSTRKVSILFDIESGKVLTTSIN